MFAGAKKIDCPIVENSVEYTIYGIQQFSKPGKRKKKIALGYLTSVLIQPCEGSGRSRPSGGRRR